MPKDYFISQSTFCRGGSGASLHYEVKFKEEDLSSFSLCLALSKLQDSFEAELHPSSSVSK